MPLLLNMMFTLQVQIGECRISYFRTNTGVWLNQMKLSLDPSWLSDSTAWSMQLILFEFCFVSDFPSTWRDSLCSREFDIFFINSRTLNIKFFALLPIYYSTCYISNSFSAGHIHLWRNCYITDEAEQNAHLIFAYCTKMRAHLCFLGRFS